MGVLLCAEPPASSSSRNDAAALFEEVLWQPTAEETENELAEGQQTTVTDESKEGLLS